MKGDRQVKRAAEAKASVEPSEIVRSAVVVGMEIDEGFVLRAGHYLWRVVDEDGDVLDILVQSRFFRKLLKRQGCVPRRPITDKRGGVSTRISDLAVVPYRQDQSPRLDFWGSDVRNDTREGDTLWVHYTTSHFSSRSTVS